MTDNYQKLQDLLSELFEFDKADLDFGIYRIMNQKREEVARFLNEDLLPQVKETLQEAQSTSSTRLQQELEEAIEQLEDLEMDPDESPKVQQLRERIGDPEALEALEDEIFSRLHNFFSRYYKEGDFISLRRYKEGVYAIPYEGEEVKLHWANHDQYYIKTSEYFSDYTFELPDERRVHFRIEEAASERDNNIPLDDTSRRFVLADEDAISEEDGELVIRFHYKPVDTRQWQSTINAEIAETIIEADDAANWKAQLETLRPTDANPDRTVLDRHLDEYTARNTFDYFIHKDLKGFLRRELDFYIKSEVLHLDDIEGQTAVRVEQQLGKIRALRKVAHKIIDFLAQLEDFQKCLWLKKKFVVDSQYCVTLDKIPSTYYAEIAANTAQIEEWRRLNLIEEDSIADASVDERLLQDNPYLMVDTAHFPYKFRMRLAASLDHIDQHSDGLIIQGENFQALSLLRQCYADRVQAIYIDPPYNAAATEIAYKNGYKHASWLALMADRLALGRSFLAPTGLICVTIDDYEVNGLQFLMERVFGRKNHLGTVCIRNNPSGRATVRGFAVNHEYGLFYAKDAEHASVGRLPHSEEQAARYGETDNEGRQFEWENFRKNSSGSMRADRPRQFFPIYYNPETEELRVPDLEWQPEADAWDALESPSNSEVILLPTQPDGLQRVWRFGIERTIDELSEMKVEEREGRYEVYKKKYISEEGSLPRTWWDDAAYSARDRGTRTLRNLLGPKTDFSFPKAVAAVQDSLRIASLGDEDVAFDYFAGSGTTGQAVIDLNREDGGARKYILVEMGEYFDSVLLPRIKKAVFSDRWDDGKPVSGQGSSHLLKYIRLESYEDTLNNLKLNRTEEQQQTLDEADASVREEYMLGYMLDIEARGSQSLLNVEAFRNPFDYTLNIATGVVGETTPMTVDLVETFNYLIGLTVSSVRQIDNIRVVEGTTPDGERALVLWRDLDEVDNDALDEWFEEQGFAAPDAPYDLIYVNGDNNLGRLRPSTQTWSVRLIDDDFHRLMFDVQDEWS